MKISKVQSCETAINQCYSYDLLRSDVVILLLMKLLDFQLFCQAISHNHATIDYLIRGLRTLATYKTPIRYHISEG